MHEDLALLRERRELGAPQVEVRDDALGDELVEHLGDGHAVRVGRVDVHLVLAGHVLEGAAGGAEEAVVHEGAAGAADEVAGVLRRDPLAELGVLVPGRRDLVAELGHEVGVVPEHHLRDVVDEAVRLAVELAGPVRGAEAVEGVGVDLVVEGGGPFVVRVGALRGGEETSGQPEPEALKSCTFEMSSAACRR